MVKTMLTNSNKSAKDLKKYYMTTISKLKKVLILCNEINL